MCSDYAHLHAPTPPPLSSLPVLLIPRSKPSSVAGIDTPHQWGDDAERRSIAPPASASSAPSTPRAATATPASTSSAAAAAADFRVLQQPRNLVAHHLQSRMGWTEAVIHGHASAKPKTRQNAQAAASMSSG
jgi:hypothetical protein